MAHQLLTISRHVAWITLHNPPANVLNLSVLKELELVLSEVEEDEYVRVVVEVPGKLSHEERELLEKLAGLQGKKPRDEGLLGKFGRRFGK